MSRSNITGRIMKEQRVQEHAQAHSCDDGRRARQLDDLDDAANLGCAVVLVMATWGCSHRILDMGV